MYLCPMYLCPMYPKSLWVYAQFHFIIRVQLQECFLFITTIDEANSGIGRCKGCRPIRLLFWSTNDSIEAGGIRGT